jgi:hypothetical protein
VDSISYDPRFLLSIVETGALEEDPFVLVDVGCGLGIDPSWRLFGNALSGHGFDPQVAEIERLRAEEAGGMQYRAAFIGLPDDHPIPQARRERSFAEEAYFDLFRRTSAAAAAALATQSGQATFYETNDWLGLELASEKIGLADALRREGVERVDFVKIDTDGSDLDVLISFEEMIQPSGVLGFMVETPFTGSAHESTNTFHTIDPLLKRHGFQIAAMTVNRYSRAVLPAQFKYAILAQTVQGQPLWGDLVYVRDAVHPDWRRYGDLSPTKLLKLACIYDLFELPDLAVEMLLMRRHELEALVDVDAMLDLLTPPLDGEQVSYREYIAAFEADPTRFYPPPPVVDEPPPPPPPTPIQRVKGVLARTLGRA